MTTKSLSYPNSKLWLAAIKPPMYSVAVIPIGVGTAAAFSETGTIQSGIFQLFDRSYFDCGMDQFEQ